MKKKKGNNNSTVVEQSNEGRKRVIIENVRPSIDAGRFAVKKIIGDTVLVEADIFADGHDTVVAKLQFRKPSDPNKWEEKPMEFVGNDLWRAQFTVDEVGRYEFNIVAWVDHFATWQKGLRKKLEAAQDVGLDLLIGAELVEAAVEQAPSRDAKILAEHVLDLRSENRQVAIITALCDELTQLTHKYTDRSLAATLEKSLAIVSDPKLAEFSAWYEFFPRSWGSSPGKHGTFRDCERILPQIADLGFNVVYLPPIHPIGVTKRKGKNNSLQAQPGDVGSPWAIGSAEGGHKSIHPELGDEKDFKSFIRTADKVGIKIAIDIAFQCSPDHPYVKQHPEWFHWRPDGTVQYAENPPKKYEDVLPINFETKDWDALWQELKSVFIHWIKAGVRIFRVDNPHTKSFGFWEWAISEIKAEYPDTIFLAEAFTRPKLMYRLAKLGFTHGYTYFTWRGSKQELTEYMTELTAQPVCDFFRPNFWPNTPDILTPILQTGKRPAFINRFILAATLSSNYGIYGPAYELCEHEPYPGKEEYNVSEKYEIKSWDWHRPGNIKSIMQRVNRIRMDHPALQKTNNIQFLPVDNPALIAYSKMTADRTDILVIVVNLDPDCRQSGWLKLPLLDYGIGEQETFRAYDMLAGDKYFWRGDRTFIEINPHDCPAHIFHLTRS